MSGVGWSRDRPEDRLEQAVHERDTTIARLRAEVESQRATIARLEAERLRWIVQLLKARDEFAKNDLAEAWHHLYKIANPDFTKLEPWAEFELEVAALPPASKSVQKRIAAQKGEPYPFKEK